MRGFPVGEELYGKHLRADHSCTGVKCQRLTWRCKRSQLFHSSFNNMDERRRKQSRAEILDDNLSVKSKKKKIKWGILLNFCTINTFRLLQRKTSWGSLRTCVRECTCEIHGDVRLRTQSQHSSNSSTLSPCQAPTHPRKMWNTFVHVEISLAA